MPKDVPNGKNAPPKPEETDDTVRVTEQEAQGNLKHPERAECDFG